MFSNGEEKVLSYTKDAADKIASNFNDLNNTITQIDISENLNESGSEMSKSMVRTLKPNGYVPDTTPQKPEDANLPPIYNGESSFDFGTKTNSGFSIVVVLVAVLALIALVSIVTYFILDYINF